jgi:hypothetical protein
MPSGNVPVQHWFAQEISAMADSALKTFSHSVCSAWGPLTSDLVAHCRQQLKHLLNASRSEEWLATLHRKQPANEELYRDPTHGFVLLAHAEKAGLYRPPHDHGRGWVIYAVQEGEIAMCSYAPTLSQDGHIQLVRRDSGLVCAGQLQVYLPGDIHDTRCMTDHALLYRFTDRDLRVEDQQEHRLTRFVERHGFWTVGQA